eukprot:7391919-Prymnesium_polylepis.1
MATAERGTPRGVQPADWESRWEPARHSQSSRIASSRGCTASTLPESLEAARRPRGSGCPRARSKERGWRAGIGCRGACRAREASGRSRSRSRTLGCRLPTRRLRIRSGEQPPAAAPPRSAPATTGRTDPAAPRRSGGGGADVARTRARRPHGRRS